MSALLSCLGSLCSRRRRRLPNAATRNGDPDVDSLANPLDTEAEKGDDDYPEEKLEQWCELVPNQSKVRIVAGPEEMLRLCLEVGNNWSSRVHHMNGNIYTVVGNLPPMRYLVYDPVCDKRGIQDGRIYVPYKAVAVVREPEMVVMVSLISANDGSMSVFCSSFSGSELATVLLDDPTARDVWWLKGILAARLNQKSHLIKIVTGTQVLENGVKLAIALGSEAES